MSTPQREYEKAHQILGLHVDDDIDEKTLKRCYHREALRNHPDKNNSPEAHQKFVKINEAYNTARKYHGFVYSGEDEVKEEESSIPTTFMNYTNVLFTFLSPLVNSDTFQDIKTKLVYSIIENISNKCEPKALELIERLNRKQCGKICELLRNQKDVLHIPASFMEKMELLYTDKLERDECIRIYPSLNDLYSENVYKLENDNKTYYIPLWHHELVYDNAGAELYVQCIPKLDDDVEIDEKNDIHVSKQVNLIDLWNSPQIDILIGTKQLFVQTKQLKLQRNQTVKIPCGGISRINMSDIYDVSKKSSVYVHLTITNE